MTPEARTPAGSRKRRRGRACARPEGSRQEAGAWAGLVPGMEARGSEHKFLTKQVRVGPQVLLYLP